MRRSSYWLARSRDHGSSEPFLPWAMVALSFGLASVVFPGSRVYAQVGEYAGPGILSRGGIGAAPSAPIAFRPYININGLYRSGLSGALTDTNNDAALGGEAAVGLYGYRAWKHTVIGVNYRGDYRRYSRRGYQDGTSQFLAFGLTHTPTRRVMITVRQGAGIFTQLYGYTGTFGFFSPEFAQIPTDDLLNTRTYYATTMVDLTYMKSPRLSFNFGGSGFMIQRALSPLYGMTGWTARGDMSYRITRHSTVGVDYYFTHFGFNKAFGSADLHSGGLDYSAQLTRSWSLALRAGTVGMETVAVGTVSIDPAVAAIIGRNRGLRVLHVQTMKPTYAASIVRRFKHASGSASYSYGPTPGNGIYTTVAQRTLQLAYSYTGMRRWSLGANASYATMRGVGQDLDRYKRVGGGCGFVRSLRSTVYLTARFDQHRNVLSSTFNRMFRSATIGLAYSPGDIPLRLW